MIKGEYIVDSEYYISHLSVNGSQITVALKVSVFVRKTRNTNDFHVYMFIHAIASAGASTVSEIEYIDRK